MMGNNFLPYGISCRSDPAMDCRADVSSHRFADSFDSVYDSRLTFHAVLGANDTGPFANASAQLAYAEQMEPRWVLPSRYYSTVISIDSATILALFLDTTTFDVPQFDWVSSLITNSPLDWIIIVGSAPVWSVGERGPTSVLLSSLKPLIERPGAAFYFSGGGGDHSLQHLAEGLGPEYVISGTGSQSSASQAHNASVPVNCLK